MQAQAGRASLPVEGEEVLFARVLYSGYAPVALEEEGVVDGRLQGPRTRDLSMRPVGAKDRAEAILRVLEGLRLAWPEPAAVNVRALTVSQVATLLGMEHSEARESLAVLDAAGLIERAPRRRRVAGVPEAAWVAVSPSRLSRHVLREWRRGYAVRSYRTLG